jgi:hypothetical protein
MIARAANNGHPAPLGVRNAILRSHGAVGPWAIRSGLPIIFDNSAIGIVRRNGRIDRRPLTYDGIVHALYGRTIFVDKNGNAVGRRHHPVVIPRLYPDYPLSDLGRLPEIPRRLVRRSGYRPGFSTIERPEEIDNNAIFILPGGAEKNRVPHGDIGVVWGLHGRRVPVDAVGIERVIPYFSVLPESRARHCQQDRSAGRQH